MMSEVLRGVVLVAATVATGLFAGLFYAFSVAVMPGLGRSGDQTFVEAMRRINVAIVNPWFLVVFLGAPALTVVAAALHLGADGRGALPWVVAAFVLLGTAFVVTVRVNIPLNNALAATGEPESVADLAGVRERFEAVWVRWNTVRAVASTAAFGCLLWALVLYGRATAVA